MQQIHFRCGIKGLYNARLHEHKHGLIGSRFLCYDSHFLTQRFHCRQRRIEGAYALSRSCIIKTITSLYEGDLFEGTLSTLTFFTHFLPSIQVSSTLSPLSLLYNHKHSCIHCSKHILALAHSSPFPPASQIRLYVRFDTIQLYDTTESFMRR